SVFTVPLAPPVGSLFEFFRGTNRLDPAAVFFRWRQGVGLTDRTDAMATRRTMKRIEQPPAAEPTLHLDERPLREELDDEPAVVAVQRGDEVETDFDTLEEHHEGELPAADELPPGELETEEEDAHAPDDALGLYLRQMGAIPLLNR